MLFNLFGPMKEKAKCYICTASVKTYNAIWSVLKWTAIFFSLSFFGVSLVTPLVLKNNEDEKKFDYSQITYWTIVACFVPTVLIASILYHQKIVKPFIKPYLKECTKLCKIVSTTTDSQVT